jgi:hypothetical protein
LTQPSLALHRTIVLVDVAGFTDRARTSIHQLAVHRGVYEVLGEAFADADIDLAACTVEDRGDGAMILVPPAVPKSVLANQLPDGLVAALRRYNAVHSAEASIRLRVVLHAGEVSQQANGVVSQAINLAFRILDAGEAKLELQRAVGALAVIASDQFYQDVIVQDPAALPDFYRQIPVSVKGTVTSAWLRLPDDAAPPTLADEAEKVLATPRMTGIRHLFWVIANRPRSLRRVTVYSLAAYGLVSVLVQIAGMDSLINLRNPSVFTGIALLACLACGLWTVYPLKKIHREFRSPGMRVTITVGDLFEQRTQLVVGFADTFDTDTLGDTVINQASLQGQFLHRVYSGNRERLDRDLVNALSRIRPCARESREDKRNGKLERYPLGTVAVLSVDGNRIFCSAYSRMGNDLVARSTVEDLWRSLNLLWETVAEHGQRAPIAMPIVGSELARIDNLDREGLLKMILLSFVAKSREKVFCKELVVVVHPKNSTEIDMAGVAAFLRTL